MCLCVFLLMTVYFYYYCSSKLDDCSMCKWQAPKTHPKIKRAGRICPQKTYKLLFWAWKSSVQKLGELNKTLLSDLNCTVPSCFKQPHCLTSNMAFLWHFSAEFRCKATGVVAIGSEPIFHRSCTCGWGLAPYSSIYFWMIFRCVFGCSSHLLMISWYLFVLLTYIFR